jgi:hypothetical protein
LLLFLTWVKTVSVGFLSHGSHFTISCVSLVIERVLNPLYYPPIPPCPRKAGFLGGFR